MTITLRTYQRQPDFKAIGDFLVAHFQPGNCDGNWLQPAWEYMHSHPFLDLSAIDRIGVWEEDGQIVAVTHYEWCLGEVFFQVAPGYAWLKPEMLDYAEAHLYGTAEDGQHFVQAYVNDFDGEFSAAIQSRGYQRSAQGDRPMSLFVIPDPFPAVSLPEGYRLKSLQEDNDLHKIDQVLWRGFNHPGEPPADGILDREKMQMTPNFRKDLTIVVETPAGDFGSFAGTWYEPVRRICYVEPVATDPTYRRLGLGRAAVLEGIRRCAALGATAAFVGSDQEFYLSFGFKKIFTSQRWVKYF